MTDLTEVLTEVQRKNLNEALDKEKAFGQNMVELEKLKDNFTASFINQNLTPYEKGVLDFLEKASLAIESSNAVAVCLNNLLSENGVLKEGVITTGKGPTAENFAALKAVMKVHQDRIVEAAFLFDRNNIGNMTTEGKGKERLIKYIKDQKDEIGFPQPVAAWAINTVQHIPRFLLYAKEFTKNQPDNRITRTLEDIYFTDAANASSRLNEKLRGNDVLHLMEFLKNFSEGNGKPPEALKVLLDLCKQGKVPDLDPIVLNSVLNKLAKANITVPTVTVLEPAKVQTGEGAAKVLAGYIMAGIPIKFERLSMSYGADVWIEALGNSPIEINLPSSLLKNPKEVLKTLETIQNLKEDGFRVNSGDLPLKALDSVMGSRSISKGMFNKEEKEEFKKVKQSIIINAMKEINLAIIDNKIDNVGTPEEVTKALVYLSTRTYKGKRKEGEASLLDEMSLDKGDFFTISLSPADLKNTDKVIKALEVAYKLNEKGVTVHSSSAFTEALSNPKIKAEINKIKNEEFQSFFKKGLLPKIAEKDAKALAEDPSKPEGASTTVAEASTLSGPAKTPITGLEKRRKVSSITRRQILGAIDNGTLLELFSPESDPDQIVKAFKRESIPNDVKIHLSKENLNDPEKEIAMLQFAIALKGNGFKPGFSDEFIMSAAAISKEGIKGINNEEKIQSLIDSFILKEETDAKLKKEDDAKKAASTPAVAAPAQSAFPAEPKLDPTTLAANPDQPSSVASLQSIPTANTGISSPPQGKPSRIPRSDKSEKPPATPAGVSSLQAGPPQQVVATPAKSDPVQPKVDATIPATPTAAKNSLREERAKKTEALKTPGASPILSTKPIAAAGSENIASPLVPTATPLQSAPPKSPIANAGKPTPPPRSASSEKISGAVVPPPFNRQPAFRQASTEAKPPHVSVSGPSKLPSAAAGKENKPPAQPPKTEQPTIDQLVTAINNGTLWQLRSPKEIKDAFAYYESKGELVELKNALNNKNPEINLSNEQLEDSKNVIAWLQVASIFKKVEIAAEIPQEFLQEFKKLKASVNPIPEGIDIDIWNRLSAAVQDEALKEKEKVKEKAASAASGSGSPIDANASSPTKIVLPSTGMPKPRTASAPSGQKNSSTPAGSSVPQTAAVVKVVTTPTVAMRQEPPSYSAPTRSTTSSSTPAAPSVGPTPAASGGEKVHPRDRGVYPPPSRKSLESVSGAVPSASTTAAAPKSSTSSTGASQVPSSASSATGVSRIPAANTGATSSPAVAPGGVSAPRSQLPFLHQAHPVPLHKKGETLAIVQLPPGAKNKLGEEVSKVAPPGVKNPLIEKPTNIVAQSLGAKNKLGEEVSKVAPSGVKNPLIEPTNIVAQFGNRTLSWERDGDKFLYRLSPSSEMKAPGGSSEIYKRLAEDQFEKIRATSSDDLRAPFVMTLDSSLSADAQKEFISAIQTEMNQDKNRKLGIKVHVKIGTEIQNIAPQEPSHTLGLKGR